MPQIISCRCGQSFQAADHLLGQTVPCPACGTPLTIPGSYYPPQAPVYPPPQPFAPPQPPPTPAYSGRVRQCPSCGQAMPVEARSCPHCWYMIDQGPRLNPVAATPSAPAKAEAAEWDPKFVHTVIGTLAHAITLGTVAIVYAQTKDWVAAGFLGGGPGWLVLLFVGAPMCLIGSIQKGSPHSEIKQRGERTLFWGQVLCFWGFAMGALGGAIANLIGGYAFEK